MKRKIKVYIKTADHNINLPKISLSTAGFLAKMALKFSQNNNFSDDNVKALVVQNQKYFQELIKVTIDMLNDMDPFILVDVKSQTERIYIEVL